ncbi:MAG: flagellar motor switch protein FliN [Nitrospinota bacterium]
MAENSDTSKGTEKEGNESKKKTSRDISMNMDMFLDIAMTVSTELGQAKMTVRDVVALNKGSVIELSKLVGEPMEIFINGLMIARGEVVVVNEKFGVRVTDVVDSFEERRIASLES